MGLITGFRRNHDSQPNFRTEIECGWNFAEVDGKLLLRLETYGSADREVPGKRSQSMELDEEGARRLAQILEQVFPLLTGDSSVANPK